jgi:hypothetical protein
MKTDSEVHRARIVGPVSYWAGAGRKQNIPVGPCLIERVGGQSIDVIWGARGQRSVSLSVEEIEAAREGGNLVLLD